MESCAIQSRWYFESLSILAPHVIVEGGDANLPRRAMRRLPPLNALRAFEAAARLSSVAAAASELGVSHSAVSQQIGLLEEYLGQELFKRPGRRIEPTPVALAFLEDVQMALDRLANASSQLARREGGERFTINATASVAQRWVIPKIAAFDKIHSNIDLRLTISRSDDISHLDMPYDFVVRRMPMERQGYSCQFLVDDQMAPLLHPDLARDIDLCGPTDLLRLKLLHMRSRPDAWKQWFIEAGVPVQSTLDGPYFDHFFLSLEAAAHGLGVALAPLALVERDLAEGRLVAPMGGLTVGGPGFHILYRTELRLDRNGGKVLAWLTSGTVNTDCARIREG